MTKKQARPTTIDLAKEAARFSADNDFDRSGGWVKKNPDDDVRGAAVAISLRLPGRQIQLLKEIARREGIGYQTLMKRWLDDRLRDELTARRSEKPAAKRMLELTKELEWARRELARATR
ncbi:MAG TPA: hypothetical protein VJ787_07120 [Thermoleophilia bacterium]|nr:hypothetical protein [Thermoleophilia bacterium]